MPDFGIVFPAWNYSRQTPEFLDQVVGEIRLDRLTIPAVTPAQEQFRLALDKEQPYFATEGGWHFPPDAKLYAATSLRPRSAKWCAGRDHVAPLVEYAASHGLALHFLIDAHALPEALGAPHLARVSAWGQVHRDAPLCFNNPIAREMVEATLRDLRRYAPAAVQIDRLGERVAAEAGVCFCPACKQIARDAGADADLAARHVRLIAEAGWEGEADRADVRPLRLHAHPRSLLRGYVAAGADSLARWFGAVAQRTAAITSAPDAGAEASPLRFRILRPAPRIEDVGAGEIASSAAASEGDAAVIDSGRESAGEAGTEISGDAGSLVRAIRARALRGDASIDFVGVEEAPRAAVTWLRQAVRYARRG